MTFYSMCEKFHNLKTI